MSMPGIEEPRKRVVVIIMTENGRGESQLSDQIPLDWNISAGPVLQSGDPRTAEIAAASCRRLRRPCWWTRASRIRWICHGSRVGLREWREELAHRGFKRKPSAVQCLPCRIRLDVLKSYLIVYRDCYEAPVLPTPSSCGPRTRRAGLRLSDREGASFPSHGERFLLSV